MSNALATPLPSAGRARPRRKTRDVYYESVAGFVLMVAGLGYGMYLNFRYDPSMGALPLLLLVLGFLLIQPAVRRVERRGRRAAR